MEWLKYVGYVVGLAGFIYGISKDNKNSAGVLAVMQHDIIEIKEFMKKMCDTSDTVIKLNGKVEDLERRVNTLEKLIIK